MEGSQQSRILETASLHTSGDDLWMRCSATSRTWTQRQDMRLGALFFSHAYWPFGEEITAQGQDDLSHKYTGHERDFESNLDYMHARYYNNFLGRFLSFDNGANYKRSARLPQMWNRYQYSVNNPLKYIDPTGEDVYIITFSASPSGNVWDQALNAEQQKYAYAFSETAKAEANKIQTDPSFDAEKDVVVLKGVSNTEQFIDTVNNLPKDKGPVRQFSLYHHGSEEGGGLGFGLTQMDTNLGNWFSTSDISKLHINFAKDAQVNFNGCSIGMTNPYTKENFAKEFSLRNKGVKVSSYDGPIEFKEQHTLMNDYKVVPAKDTKQVPFP